MRWDDIFASNENVEMYIDHIHDQTMIAIKGYGKR